MISYLVHFTQTTLVPLGSLGVFFGSMLGEFVGPLPAISMIIGATFSLVQHIHFSFWLIMKIFFMIAIPDALGATLGSFVLYSAGYYGGKPVIEKWGKYMRISWGAVEKFRERMEKTSKDEWFLFLVRAVPLFPNMLINITCGLVRVSFLRYVTITFFGMLVRAFVYGFVGWSLGSTYKIYSRFFVRYERNILIITGISAFVFFVWFIIKKRKKKKNLV